MSGPRGRGWPYKPLVYLNFMSFELDMRNRPQSALCRQTLWNDIV